MKPLPEKIKAPTIDTTTLPPGTTSTGTFQGYLSLEDKRINEIIDHLTDYEADLDRRLTELENRIQEISINQLGVKRGEAHFVPVPFKGTEAIKEQPKRWRANANEMFWYVTHWGDVTQGKEFYEEDTQFRYAIGNYHQTREEAEAYKQKLLSQNI